MTAPRSAQRGKGIYPIRIAARLAHLDPKTARRWIEGYDYAYQGERRHSAPITFLARTPHEGAERIVDFEQLLTLLLVKAFKDRGLGLPTIKRAASRAHELYGTPNPFITRRFRSDGNHVFIDLEPTVGRERSLINVLSSQHEFRDIVEPSLFRDVVFVGDDASEWWPLGRDRSVVLIPIIQFGAPHIAGGGVRTDVVAQSVAAEGGDETAIATTAAWYGLTPEQVTDAVAFEGPWRTLKAA